MALAQAAASVNHAALRNQIEACTSVQDFINVYELRDVAQLCMGCLRRAQGFDNSLDDWAREWAIRMRQQPPPPFDAALYECCQSLLLLIFTVLDRWRDGTIAADDIVRRFQGHRFTNILQLTLPMDRARCLYTLRYPQAVRFGMHWIAPQHVSLHPNWQQELNNLNGFPTMNERYLWLVENQAFTELGLAQDRAIIVPSLELIQNPHLDEE